MEFEVGIVGIDIYMWFCVLKSCEWDVERLCYFINLCICFVIFLGINS